MKTNQIIILAAVVLVIACVGLYALSDKETGGLNNSSSIRDSDYYPVTVTTSIGGVEYQQTFTKKPERIVSMWATNLELLHYFGLEDKIVGAYAVENYVALNEDLQDEYDAFDKMPMEARSIEVVRSLDPDIIIGWSSSFNDGAGSLGSVESWNNYGINCFATNRPSASVEDYIKLLENIGIIFNMQDVSNQKIAELNAKLENVKEKTSKLNESEKVTALVIEAGSADGGAGHFVYGSKFLTGDLVKQAGGINLFDGSMEALTSEKIASYDPDIIFIMAGDGLNPYEIDEAVTMFKTDPAFASMTDNVVAFRFNELYMGGILSDTIIDRMFEAMYPEFVSESA